MNFIISISLHICVMKVAFILFKAPLEPEMNLSQILLDGNPPLCQTPKPKRFRTEEMIDIQTQLLKEVAALRKVQEEFASGGERKAGNKETNTRNKERKLQ